MEENGHRCDGPGCTERRGESNHWVLAKMKSHVEGTSESFTGIVLSRWNDKDAHKRGTMHLCGTGCVSKIVSAALEGWK